jgi:Leucine Rich repeat
LPELTSIEIMKSDLLTDEVLRSLKTLRSLEELNLGSARRVADQGFEHLGSLPRLKTLRIAVNSVTDEGLRRLAQSKTLCNRTTNPVS